MNIGEYILYEDNHLIIVNKPAGLLVQGDDTGDAPLSELTKKYIKEKYHKPGNVFTGVIHRLDRPTSGCIVLARTSKALSRMTRLFADRSIKKTYWAVVSPLLNRKRDTLIHHIEKREDKNKVICSQVSNFRTKEAELSYKTLKTIGTQAIVEIELKTGRKHQIRAQMSAIGSIVVGDLKYGYPYPNDDKSICLHSRSLAFIHPVSQNYMEIKAPLPKIREWEVAYSLE